MAADGQQTAAGSGLAPPQAGEGERSLLRFITCGSVDDGKSTLIGRLLHDTGVVPEDQLEALEADSRRLGRDRPDLSLLVDGLAAEREQGITIDVAYRYFGTARRKFIVADTPGHEQYTRNMVTGASTADAAVILVDAEKGVLPQTRRHTCLMGLIGVRKVVLAVNKMDRVAFSQSAFQDIVAEYQAFAARVGLADVEAIPVAAVDGDNVTSASPRTPWYAGPTLLQWLETVEATETARSAAAFLMPVQWVNRAGGDFRGYSGAVLAGEVRPGDRVRALPSGRVSSVDRLVGFEGDLDVASAGQALTLTLSDPIDLGRGDVLAAVDQPPEVADQFEATVFWMAQEPLLPGRAYLMKIGAKTVSAQITQLKHRLDVTSLDELAARTLGPNEIGVANISLAENVAFTPYADNRDLGGFILIDRYTHATVGAGVIRFALRRSHNVHWQALDVNKASREAMKGQKSRVVWFTGLSGAGKSTIANLVERRLHAEGRHTYLLDGDNVRHGLNRDLGFSEADRVENIRRVAEVARMMVDAGLIVLVSFISPFRSERRMARERVEPGEFIEVFVDAPLEVAEARDPKGLYRKARRGELSNFTGVDSPYEAPEAPDIHLDASGLTPDAAAEQVLEHLRRLDEGAT
jgi:bifunctional enzyme CysN/CysC